jgi:hypothetical protein
MRAWCFPRVVEEYPVTAVEEWLVQLIQLVLTEVYNYSHRLNIELALQSFVHSCT